MERARVHPQLEEIYSELYNDLIRDGMSDAEAQRRLHLLMDWSLALVTRPILLARTDEFATTEKVRRKSAEAGADLAQAWMYLKIGGVDKETLKKFTNECDQHCYEMMLYWIQAKGLMEKFTTGISTLAYSVSD